MKKRPMTRTAALAIGVLTPYVKSKLAADKGVDLRSVLCNLTAADLRDRKPAIVASIKKACRGKLAKDTTLGEVAEFLDMLEAHGGQIEPGGMGGEGFEDEDEAVEPAVHNAMEKSAIVEPEEQEQGPEAAEMKPKPEMGEGGEEGMEEDDEDEELKNFLRGKLSEEDFARVCEMMGHGPAVEEDEFEQEGGHEKKGEQRLKALGAEGGDPSEAVKEGEEEKASDEMEEGVEEKEHDMTKDNPPEFKGAPRPGGKVTGDKKKVVTQDEMAKAIQAAAEAERKTQRDIREAERVVQPWVGNLSMNFDSAEQVYRKALKMIGVPGVDRVHESALRTILEMQPKPGARKAAVASVASDESVKVESFFKRFGDAGRIRLQ